MEKRNSKAKQSDGMGRDEMGWDLNEQIRNETTTEKNTSVVEERET